MKYLVTADEMKRYDRNTIETIGIPGQVLMERAALEAFWVVEARLQGLETAGKRVFLLVGMGNNGGDGLALARMLCEAGYEVEIRCVGDPSRASGQWQEQRKILEHYPVCFCEKRQREEYTVLVDALFGVGLSRQVTGEFAQAIEDFNAAQGWKIALDIPSGIDSDTGKVLGCAVRAETTVTFAFLKRGLVFFPGAEYAGEVICGRIGISETSFLGEEPGMFYLDEEPEKLLPARNPAGNKGTFGKVLLVAGSNGMAGAAVLAARAAYRSGAGMVKVITAPQNREIVQSTVPEALYGTGEDLEKSMHWADVIVIGPGIGLGEEARVHLEKVLKESKLPVVVDADGLNLLATDRELSGLLKERGMQGMPTVLTPHVGELSRLTGYSVAELKEDLPGAGAELAGKWGIVVVAKDARTFICRGNGPVCVNLRGNSGMATAGSGDVLAGILGGLLAQGMDPFAAACAGVSLHGAVGDRVAEKVGEHACMAGDLADEI